MTELTDAQALQLALPYGIPIILEATQRLLRVVHYKLQLGVQDAPTEDAIRVYQARLSQDVTGQPTLSLYKALCKHVGVEECATLFDI